jgi:hypothetical protein
MFATSIIRKKLKLVAVISEEQKENRKTVTV